MTAEQSLKIEIKERVEHISAERLEDVLDFIKHIEADSEIQEIMGFAGLFKDLDTEIFDNLTVHLPESRQMPVL